MSTKENNDPILNVNVKSIKNDILMFKNETLKDFKEAQKKITEKYQSLDFEISERLQSYENRITTYENKVMELSKLINTDKTIRGKVDNLMEFKEKTLDSMLTEKIRLDNFRNDLNHNVDRIDQILKDSVIYPGIIGGISKYKTFHDFMDYVLTQCSMNLTFREKSILDLKEYKTKLENTISSFNVQTNTILNTTSEFTKTCVKELEEKINSIFNIYDDRLQDSRIENANYAIGLEKATDSLKKELENLYVIRQELFDKVDKGLTEVKNDNTRVVKLFSGYKKNFHIMQHKFTQLSDFIKDIRFRINLKEDVNRREYSHMSDLINFDKKKKKGFYDGVYDINLIKKGLGSQLKDYIEGRITADQLFKKRTDVVRTPNETTNKKRNSGEFESSAEIENKFSFSNLLKKALTSKATLEMDESKFNQKSAKKEIIKEEEDENNNSSKEINPVFYKTLKEKNINRKNLLEKEKEDKKIDTATNPPPKEEKKLQIVSKDKEEVKEEEKKDEKNNDEPKKDKPNLKNVIMKLVNAKSIIGEMMHKEGSQNASTNKSPTDKRKNNNKNAEGTTNNKSELNISPYAKKEENKNQTNNQNANKDIANISSKKNNNNNNNNSSGRKSNKQSNIGILTNNETANDKKKNRLHSAHPNKNTTQEMNTITYNLYNPTMNSLGQYIQSINYKMNRKQIQSSNPKSKYYLKPNNIPSGNKKEDTKAIENMFNNLNNYVTKNDINFDETNYLGFKKKK